MSPVARGRARTGHTGRALVVAAIGVILALGLAFGVAVLASRGSVEVRLGDETFIGQDAEQAAREIAENGPILFPDAASGDQDIYLQHLGDAPLRGWHAFEARPPSAPRQCTVQWDPAPSGDRSEGVFRLLDPDGEATDVCDGQEFPADGEGLPRLEVTVRDGRLDVDLNAAERTATTGG